MNILLTSTDCFSADSSHRFKVALTMARHLWRAPANHQRLHSSIVVVAGIFWWFFNAYNFLCVFFVVSTIRYFFCFVCFKCDYNISLFSFLHPKISYSLFLSTEEKSRRLKLFDLSSYRFHVWAHFFFFWTKSENVCKLRSDNEFGIYGGLDVSPKGIILINP